MMKSKFAAPAKLAAAMIWEGVRSEVSRMSFKRVGGGARRRMEDSSV